MNNVSHLQVAIIFLVIYCEGIEIQSKNIVKTCYSHQESLSGTVLENQLLRFAEISEHLLPHFTAAGFVKVNKSLLSSIFSATITYLIIIIQFDISLKKKQFVWFEISTLICIVYVVPSYFSCSLNKCSHAYFM